MTVTVDDVNLKAIADAIRSKNGTEETYKPSEMADAIYEINTDIGDIKQILEVPDENIVSITVPEGVTKLKPYCFDEHDNLESVSLPSSLVEIGGSAFANCRKLSTINLPDGLVNLYARAFEECDALTEITIPEGVTQIYEYTFGWCDNLTTVTFKGKPTSIKGNAFAYCPNLTTINVPWAEGEVANAPWGSTGDAVNYNYEG